MDAKLEFEVDVDVEGSVNMMDVEKRGIIGDGWMIRRGDDK